MTPQNNLVKCTMGKIIPILYLLLSDYISVPELTPAVYTFLPDYIWVSNLSPGWTAQQLKSR